MNHPHYLYKSY